MVVESHENIALHLLFSACLSFVYVVALLKQRFMWTEDGVDAVLEGVVAVCLIV